MEIKPVLMDYKQVKKALSAEFIKTTDLIDNGEKHLDNIAEGYEEADQVLWKMFMLEDKYTIVSCSKCKHCKDQDGKYYCTRLNMRCPDDSEFFCKYSCKQ